MISSRAIAGAAHLLSVPALGREYDYRRFCTTAWKVGNSLRHCGVRGGATIALADDPLPEPILSFFGTALLGGVARFSVSSTAAIDARVLITSVERGGRDLPPGSRRIVYGSPPDDPSVAYFERDVWSENPTEPPDDVTPDQPVLRTDEKTYTHADLLDAAQSVVDRWELTVSDVVAVRASLCEPGTIVAGVVAPLLAGGTILRPDSERVGDCAVSVGNAPEARALAPETVEFDCQ